jgi:acyl-coenzyme A synthetase/AMP-(fatty) acid ligase
MSKNLSNLIDLKKDLNKIAIICDDLKITYRALDILANHVSYCLLKKGIKKGDSVSIISENSIDFAIIYLGILKLGAVAVLINVKLPQFQIDYIIKSTNSKLVIKNISDFNIEQGIEYFFNTDIEENDPAIVLHTSGTTSTPKKIISTHKRRSFLDILSEKMPEQNVILASPLYHNSGLHNLELSLISHSTLILLSKFDVKKFIESIQKYKIEKISSIPTMMNLLLNEKKLLKDTDLSSVKRIHLSSSPLNKNLYDKLTETFNNAKIINKYGSTEAGPGLFSDHPYLPIPPLSVGYPIKSINYRIIDNILQIKSPYMMTKNNLTEDGYFITNDLFYVDQNGFYYYNGRSDDMFINGGNNIYPRQIESVLELHQYVKQAAVIGIEDEIKGMKPYAFVTISNHVNEEELKNYLLNILPPSHCPKKIWIREVIPLTLINKIDKIKLKEIANDLL